MGTVLTVFAVVASVLLIPALGLTAYALRVGLGATYPSEWLARSGIAITTILAVGQVGVVVSRPFVPRNSGLFVICAAAAVAIGVFLMFAYERSFWLQTIPLMVSTIIASGLFATMDISKLTWVMLLAVVLTVLNVVGWVLDIRKSFKAYDAEVARKKSVQPTDA